MSVPSLQLASELLLADSDLWSCIKTHVGYFLLFVSCLCLPRRPCGSLAGNWRWCWFLLLYWRAIHPAFLFFFFFFCGSDLCNTNLVSTLYAKRKRSHGESGPHLQECARSMLPGLSLVRAARDSSNFVVSQIPEPLNSTNTPRSSRATVAAGCATCFPQQATIVNGHHTHINVDHCRRFKGWRGSESVGKGPIAETVRTGRDRERGSVVPLEPKIRPCQTAS